MNILITTGHPAQVHNFKFLKWELENQGHKVFWLASDKDISRYLLDHYQINYTILPKPQKSLLSKFNLLIKNALFVSRFIRQNKIDIAISRVSPYISLACFVLRKTHFALTDTETAGFYDKFFSKFVSVLFTAKSFRRTLRGDQIRFDGNIELFYLHPNRFQPAENVSDILDVDASDKYIIMRFVSWDAYHDKGLSGFSDANKLKAVTELSKYAKVFITSEKELPPDLMPYRIKIPPEKMHDVLANATLFFGESSTMASESAVLGTPAIYLNENWFGCTDEEMEYGLLFSFKANQSEQIKAIEKGLLLLKDKDIKTKMSNNRATFLEKKIDITAFMLWFIENYPESFAIMKKDPDFQYNFR
jgi:predicted glycosyltransferase